MNQKSLLSFLFVDLLLPAACILNIYIYFYPLLYHCAFPIPSQSPQQTNTPLAAGESTAAAPFRLLALADPQIEGDNKLRKYQRPPPRRQSNPATKIWELPFIDWIMDEVGFAFLTVRKYGKMLDLWGNDLYLSHVYRTVKKHTRPTHIAVLGDLLSSQWISDAEFERRGERFWKKIFSDARAVKRSEVARVAETNASGEGKEWADRIIMLPGNHDIGYAGDMTRNHLERFENTFGPDNYWLTIKDPSGEGELRVAVLNSLTLDTPIFDPSLAVASHDFLHRLEQNTTRSSNQATVLLTHLPLHKPAGVCVDGPEITYYPPWHGSGIRSQNFLLSDSSDNIKSRVFGLPSEPARDGKSRGIILTGHDHEGCRTVHYWDDDAVHWKVTAGIPKNRNQTLEEITVRSMMGEFGGNAGLLSAWYQKDTSEWKFEYSGCALGVQHLWWTTHIVNLICALCAVLLGFVTLIRWLQQKTKHLNTEKKTQ